MTKSNRAMPAPEEIIQAVRYEDGKLFWLVRQVTANGWNTKFAGKEAFNSVGTNGYKFGHYKHQRIATHWIVWVIHHGKWPDDVIDHINGDHLDNRIENLRAATFQQNMWNAKVRRDNKTGYKGVSPAQDGRGFIARIVCSGRRFHLGKFETPEDAHEAYRKAAVEKFGQFARADKITQHGGKHG